MATTWSLGRPVEGKPVLVAGHLDTVWSHGTLDIDALCREWHEGARPGDLRHEGRQLSGVPCGPLDPATAHRDAQTDRAAAHPGRGGRQPDQPLVDRAGGRQAATVLIPEPAGAGGACVTARKGVGRFTMRVEGRGSHAGGAFEDGASAIVELSHQIIGLHRMVDIDAASR